MNLIHMIQDIWKSILSQPAYVSILQIILLFIVVILLNIIIYCILARVSRRLQHTHPYRNALIQSAHLPISLLIWLMSASTAIRLFSNWLDTSQKVYIDLFQKLLIVILISSFFIKFFHLSFNYLKRNQFKKSILSQSAGEAIYKLALVFIVTATLLSILQILSISISGLLAFGGLGGLMVGFAAKDTLMNLFSGMMLYLDKPFQVGERVNLPNKNIAGTVEHIGFRQTCIRNYDLQPIYIPNALFSSTPVITPSRMYNRRMKHTIGVRYKDFNKISNILQDIRDFIYNNEALNTQRPTYINMTEFGAYSINIYISCFSQSIAYADFLKAQEVLLIKIGHIIQKHDADFAFPTQTLEISKADSIITQKT
ncbi:MAG: mechanosensitive ion channel family protein [Endozoicomonadaceae bacterium]|nr:mechanosensitive ion channel family protein [Endozoicomonadaceae bacterium]